MKATLFALFVALLMVGCGEDVVDGSKLQDRNGVTYLPNEETPFTGRAESFYENGQKKEERNYKDGKCHGPRAYWYENGQKWYQQNWKDGKQDGLQLSWEEDGTESRREIYKDGKYVRD